MYTFLKFNPFTRLALVTLPLAASLEVGTLDLGHELTWFGHLSQAQSAWIRYCALTVAIACVVMALVLHFRRGKI